MLKEQKVNGHYDATLEPEHHSWRRKCGCIRTSEKLKKILKSFPVPPPPTPLRLAEKTLSDNNDYNACYKNCHWAHPKDAYPCCDYTVDKPAHTSVPWQVISEVVQLVQLSVTATALTLYYLIYCYMQLVYYTLRSAVFFHNADLPMKITIGIVMTTSIVLGINLLLKMERILGLLT